MQFEDRNACYSCKKWTELKQHTRKTGSFLTTSLLKNKKPTKMGVYAPVPALITLIVGTVACIIGGLLFHFMPTILSNTIEQTMTLGPDTELFKMWENVPVPIYTQFYIFNYTNQEDFLENWQLGVKPQVQQLGPYTYRQQRRKIDVKWTDSDTVEYREVKTYHFVPEMSAGTEDDMVIFPNIPLATITQLAPEVEKTALKAAIQMTNTTIFVEQPVGKLLFHGYRDVLVDLIQFLTGEELLPEAMFGLFYGKNDTDDGLYRIYRGNENSKMLGFISAWNNESKLSFWTADSCNMINGTDASLFPPNVQKTDKLYIYSSELCRSVFLKFTEEIDFKGVKGYQFETDLELLGDINLTPDNECFCYPNTSSCVATGVISLSSCKGGAPVLMSSPHFLMADFHVRFAVDGLSPKLDEHKTLIQIEPNSGTLLVAKRRIQMNLQMKPVSRIPDIENLPNIVLPLIWLNESAEMNNEIIEKLHWKLFVPMQVGFVVPFVILALGAFLSLIGILCAIGLMFKSHTHVLPLMQNEPRVKSTSQGYVNTEFKD